LDDWQHGYTNYLYRGFLFKMEYGVVTALPYVAAHPHSELATRYYYMLENIREYRARFPDSSGMTNWDRNLDEVLAKTAGQTNF